MFVKDSSMHFHHSMTSTGLLILFSCFNLRSDSQIMATGKQKARLESQGGV
jgi:hypothetical protein